MNYSNIKELLNRFYAGKTSPGEEAYLKEFFSQGEVPEMFSVDQLLFRSYSKLQNEEGLGEGFDQAVLAQILGKTSPLGRRKLIFILSGMAAIALIIFTVWLSGMFSPQPYGTINNPQLAFAQAKKALLEVSESINRGLSPVRTATAEFKKPLQQVSGIDNIESSLKKVNKIGALKNAGQLMESISGVYIDLKQKK